MKWKHSGHKAKIVEVIALKGDFETNKHFFFLQLLDNIGHTVKELSGLTNNFLDCKREIGVGGNEGKKNNYDQKKNQDSWESLKKI